MTCAGLNQVSLPDAASLRRRAWRAGPEGDGGAPLGLSGCLANHIKVDAFVPHRGRKDRKSDRFVWDPLKLLETNSRNYNGIETASKRTLALVSSLAHSLIPPAQHGRRSLHQLRNRTCWHADMLQWLSWIFMDFDMDPLHLPICHGDSLSHWRHLSKTLPTTQWVWSLQDSAVAFLCTDSTVFLDWPICSPNMY